MPDHNSWIATVNQLAASASVPATEPSRAFNPCPPGVIQAGSTTDMTLRVLREGAHRWWPLHSILNALRRMGFEESGRSERSVGWALLYLRRLGLVEVRGDPRCSRYLKYRAVDPNRPEQALRHDQAESAESPETSTPAAPINEGEST